MPSEKLKKRGAGAWLILTVFLFAAAFLPAAENTILSPEDFFGFRLGDDRKIARWDRIVEYFYLLEKQSPALKVIDLGPSTMGNPFLLVIITAPANLERLEELRLINARISDPRGLAAEELERLVGLGRAVICQSMSLHATEIGGTQMAPELAFDLLNRRDEEAGRILDEVIFLMIPSFNPDGQIMVTDWYRRTLGGEYEGSDPPWLYHKYAGHDNNRDGDHLNLVESKYAARVLYRDWRPQAYVDHHHMGGYGARFYVPPYSEPIRPHADPLIWREIAWYGAHIAYKLEEAGKTGVLNAAQFPGWGHFGWHWITPFHNIAGMLTESASARLATPLYVHPEQLRAGARQFPRYEAQSTFPNPWPGGWWKLRDIVEQKKISAWALLDAAARNRETVLRNAYLKASRQIERGRVEKPLAYVIPTAQHDRLTALKMINNLLASGIEIQRAESGFSVTGVNYEPGAFVVFAAQPKLGLIRNLLGRTLYPDNEWTTDRNGLPLRPYDSATHTMHEFMGVRVDELDEVPAGDFLVLQEATSPRPFFQPGRRSYRLDGRLNDSFRAANLLLAAGIRISRVRSAQADWRAGDFIVSGGEDEVLKQTAELTGVDFLEAEPVSGAELKPLKKTRIGLYQRYLGGNMDEGWTRLLLENFSFPFSTVMDAEIRRGRLNNNFDLIILPSDSENVLLGQLGAEAGPRRHNHPPEYRSGLGREGVAGLRSFVENGGTLVALGRSWSFVADQFGLQVRNALAGLNAGDFFCPGSTVRAVFDQTQPLAWGMPAEGLLLFWNGAAFEIMPGAFNERYRTVVRYAGRELLQSGRLVGEEHLAGRGALVEADYGRGRIVLMGFPVQHRSQTHATFKLLFNVLLP